MDIQLHIMFSKNLIVFFVLNVFNCLKQELRLSIKSRNSDDDKSRDVRVEPCLRTFLVPCDACHGVTLSARDSVTLVTPSSDALCDSSRKVISEYENPSEF